jgi:hypothetical protein
MQELHRRKRIRSKLALAAALAVLGAASTAATDTIDFEIGDGQVTPSQDYAMRVTVLGASIQSGGTPMPVTVKLRVGDQSLEPFGEYSDPSEGDVNTDNSSTYVPWVTFSAQSPIRIKAKSWLNGNVYMTVDSGQNTQQVKVLRDGDAVPDIEGFENQNNIVDFVEDYIVDGHVRLDENEAIYLFELGTTNLSSSAADFQDLVVLIELAESPESLTMVTDLTVLFD